MRHESRARTQGREHIRGGNELHRTASIVVLCWRCEPLAARADLVGCSFWCFKVLMCTWWGGARAGLIGASAHRFFGAVGCWNLIYLAFVLSVAASFLLVSLARSPQRLLRVGFCPMWNFGRCGCGFLIFGISPCGSPRGDLPPFRMRALIGAVLVRHRWGLLSRS